MAHVTNELQALVTELRAINAAYVYEQARQFLTEEMGDVVDEWDAHNWFVVDDEEDGEAERGDLSPGGDGYTENEDCIPIIA
jgi:hypothetical protein